MKLKTVASTWYEADMKRGYGCKLDGVYRNLREIKKAIKESNARAVAQGYKADEYIIMLCHHVRVLDENNDVVSETRTRVRA